MGKYVQVVEVIVTKSYFFICLLRVLFHQIRLQLVNFFVLRFNQTIKIVKFLVLGFIFLSFNFLKVFIGENFLDEEGFAFKNLYLIGVVSEKYLEDFFFESVIFEVLNWRMGGVFDKLLDSIIEASIVAFRGDIGLLQDFEN